MVEGERVMGDGVNIAARIQPLAQAGDILLSDDMARQIQNKIDAPLEDLGPQNLKNIAAPMQIYRLRLPWQEARGRSPSPPSRKRPLLIGIATAAVLIAALSAGILHKQSTAPVLPPDQAKGPALALPKGPSIAVLPFNNLSGNKDDDYFSDGISEDIITALSRFNDLFVIARNSTFQFKASRWTCGRLEKIWACNTYLKVV